MYHIILNILKKCCKKSKNNAKKYKKEIKR